MYNKEINRKIRIKYLKLSKRNREVEINNFFFFNLKKNVFIAKRFPGQLLHNKEEESKTYEDINQDTSEKKMRCFGA